MRRSRLLCMALCLGRVRLFPDPSSEGERRAQWVGQILLAVGDGGVRRDEQQWLAAGGVVLSDHERRAMEVCGGDEQQWLAAASSSPIMAAASSSPSGGGMRNPECGGVVLSNHERPAMVAAFSPLSLLAGSISARSKLVRPWTKLGTQCRDNFHGQIMTGIRGRGSELDTRR